MGLLSWLSGKGESRVADLVGGDAILKQELVRSFGQTSRGKGQTRGNGTLAMTAGEVVFCLLLPRRDLRIPREAIMTVDSASSHLGKRTGATLLRITWRRDDGAQDSVAFETGDLGGWLAALGAAASQHGA